MSALLQQLVESGVTPEDLEKAASVRIFEKVAAAQNIDLSALDESQQDELFDHFQEEVLPGMVGGDEPSKEAGAEVTKELLAKVAALSEDEKIALFEKQAAAEEVDLTALDEATLQGAYGHFLENTLPAMVANGGEPVGIETAPDGAGEDKQAQAEEAAAKLAEAEILGRHMARSFRDELEKEAGVGSKAVDVLKYPGRRMKEAITGFPHGASSARSGGRVGLTPRERVTAGLKGVGAASVPAAVVGGTVYGGKKVRGKDKEAEAPIFEYLAMQKAAEILEANGIDPATGEPKQASIDELVDQRAVEMLTDLGYTFRE